MAGPAIKRRKLDEAYAGGSSKSNMFKLQVDDLLDHLRPKGHSQEPALHLIKSTIERTPAQEPKSIKIAERDLLHRRHGVAIPFPESGPPKDAKYQLTYSKPTNVNVVGSYALQTQRRSSHVVDIDMSVTMPDSLFQEKDYLNYRFFHKRAYYLACVTAALKDAHAGTFEFSYRSLHDDQLKPILSITPVQAAEPNSAHKWRINILPCISADVFAAEKLLPTRNCVRVAGEDSPHPTPFYNASLRADMLVTSYLRVLHDCMKSCPTFQDACLLGYTWLQQRGFGASISRGGFGMFEWSILMACMLEGGGPGGKPILSEGYNSYQLFKATLQLLAMRDLSKQSFNIGNDASDIKPSGDATPLFWDSTRMHNVLFKVSPWSYASLRQEARITLTMLGDQLFDGFEAAFIFKTSNASLRYDYSLEIPLASIEVPQKAGTSVDTNLRKVYDVLRRGLGDRVSHIAMQTPASKFWGVKSARPGASSTDTVFIGLAVNTDNVNRAVDHGPAAESKSEAASFRDFWGDKAELRRFRDGSIVESLIWSSSSGRPSVLEQVIRFVLQRHFGERAGLDASFTGDKFARTLGNFSGLASFQPLTDGYKQLEADIRGLDDLPLSIRQIMPADEQLRFSSVNLPSASQLTQRSSPANVTIQFEGSARWPDDLAAIQRTKIAFLLMLGELLSKSVDSVSARVGLENEENEVLNQGYLQIVYDSGVAFCLRIHHDREQTLLERTLKDKSIGPQAKEIAALGLASFKRQYLVAPAHTQAVARLCNRYPALSGTMRLMKKWFASHLLTNHIAGEVIEMMVIRTFVQPWPWQTPSSVQTGFLRTLHWLSRWDWRAEPLIVDFSGAAELKQAEAQAINTRFEAWRKLDPSMNRIVLFAASSVDPDGTTWTDGRPAKVVAGRMTALAKAAATEVEMNALRFDSESLFASSLADFDFVVHLDAAVVGGKQRKSAPNGTSYKNLQMDVCDDDSVVGFDPMHSFLQELEDTFGTAIVFFSGGTERGVIGGLWNPQTASRTWKVNLAYATVLRTTSEGDEVTAQLDKDSILSEMARLGGTLVESIQVNR